MCVHSAEQKKNTEFHEQKSTTFPPFYSNDRLIDYKKKKKNTWIQNKENRKFFK